MRRCLPIALLLSGCFTAPKGAQRPGPYAFEEGPAPSPTPSRPPTPTPSPSPSPPPSPAPAGPADPVKERADALRQAADLLDKAAGVRVNGSKSYAEQLFSSAEIITGPEALAELAPLFRAGAPPRVTMPVVVMPKETPPQPKAVGASENEEPAPPRPVRASLAGLIKIGGGGGAAGIGVVTLAPAGRKFNPPRPTQKVMEQRNRQFAPQVLVVPVGSTVSFPNFDPVFHNVFSSSEIKAFDLGLYKNGEAKSVQFDKQGIVRVACNLHKNMEAYIVVVGEPHYIVTDASGGFAFANLEPGKYTLRAWSDRSQQPVSQQVDLKPGKNSVTLGVAADAPAGPPPDKFGVSRGQGP